MKKIYILLFAALCFAACIEDDSTEAVKPISEIAVVDGTVQSEYNIHTLEKLVITPKITQTNEQKPVTYSWEIDQKIVSTNETFEYVSSELGSHNCRLILENEDGKTFFPFKIFVNSAYEEGLAVISTDPEGNSCLSFMLTPTDGSAKKFYEEESFSANNKDFQFARNVVDVVHSNKNLFLMCQGGANGGLPTIYYLNAKTFIVENMVEVDTTKFTDFKPVCLALPMSTRYGVAYPVLCQNGKAYGFSPTEAFVDSTNHFKHEYNYANACVVRSRANNDYNEILLWDKDLKTMALLYTGNGPYYCDSIYHANRQQFISGEAKNYFTDRTTGEVAYHEFRAMTYIRQTPEQIRSGAIPQMLVLTKLGNQVKKVVMCTYFHVYNDDTRQNVLSAEGMSTCGYGESPINENTPCIANQTYKTLLFAKGNKVMKWSYLSSLILQAKDMQIGIPENAEITSFEISADHKQTYVSFYEPDKQGKNGSVWVFDTDTGEVLEKYDNVCYKPVKMIYKQK